MVWRRSGAAVLALVVLSAACSLGSGQGPLAQVTQAALKTAAPNAALTDVEFDSFLKNANFRKALGPRADEVADLLHQSRAAVTTMRVPPTLAPRAQGQMVLAAGVSDVLMPLMFAELLASAFDQMTAGSTAGGELHPPPLNTSEEGPTARTTTSLNETDLLSASGSRVQLTMHWTYRMTTVDKTSGATLADLTDDRTIVGTIDVCPNAQGMAAASLDSHLQSSATLADGSTANRGTTSSNSFSGHVDDQAVLRRVTQGVNDKSSWQTSAGGRGSFDLTGSNINWSAGQTALGGFDASSVQGSVSSSGNASTTDVNNSAGWLLVMDMQALERAFYEAQRLWRNGRCVVVTAPDYKAETPVSTGDQQKMQHDETVGKGSVTKFGVNLRHRFGGGLNQPVTATLISGAKKLDPGQLRAVPAQLSYTAPDESDKQAAVQLKSVSKRGIGTLVLGFNTRTARLKLTITGTSRTTISNFVVAGQATIGPVEFAKKDDTTWKGNAPFQGTYEAGQFELPVCNQQTQYEKGSLYLTATIDTHSDPSVWVVRLGDQNRSHAEITVRCEDGSAGRSPTGSLGITFSMLNLMGDIRIPINGGTVPVHIQKNDPDVIYMVDATVTATVT